VLPGAAQAAFGGEMAPPTHSKKRTSGPAHIACRYRGLDPAFPAGIKASEKGPQVSTRSGWKRLGWVSARVVLVTCLVSP